VAVHYRSSEQEAHSLVASIRAAGGKAEAFRADLDSERACAQLISDAKQAMGDVSILINNASVFTREKLSELSEASMIREYWPNFFAPVLLTKLMAAGKPSPGHVINLLEGRIQANDARFFAYSLAKKNLADFTRLAAVELAPHIKVHGVAPGPILPPPGQDLAYLKEKGGRQLLDDALDPSAIAGAVMALLQLRGATGQILYIDNGQHLLGNGV